MLKKLIVLFFLLPVYSTAESIVFGYEGGQYADKNQPIIIQKNQDGTWSKNSNISGLPADISHSCYAATFINRNSFSII